MSRGSDPHFLQQTNREKRLKTTPANKHVTILSFEGRESTDYKPNKEVYSPSNPGPCKVKAKSGLTFRDGTCHRTP